MANRYYVNWKPFVPYIVNTNSAHKVELTASKLSRIGIELTQWQSRVPRECPVDYKLQSSGSHYCYISYTTTTLFLSCRSWWTVNMLTPTPLFLTCGQCAGAWFIWTARRSQSQKQYVVK